VAGKKAKRVRTQRAGSGDRELDALARAKWTSSGLTETHAKKLQLRALTGEEVAALGVNKAWPGLRIGYFTSDGRPTNFCRIRFFDEKRTGFAAQAVRPQKYGQPTGTLNEVYLPPLLPRPWREVLADATASLVVTEGELKAAAACAHGIACIGLGGVDMWRAGKRGLALLPDLARTEWRNRQVVIAYDSDAPVKPEVLAAQNRLAHELADRGAHVRLLSLPADRAKPDAKTGLDDYLLTHTVEDLRALLTGEDENGHPVPGAAQPFSEGVALHEMNAELVYIEFPLGLVLVKRTGQLIRVGDFIGHQYANRTYLDAEGKERSTAQAWLKWGARHQAFALTYEPGKPPEIPGEHNSQPVRNWNAWYPSGLEPVKGDVSPWTALLDHVFAGAAAEHRRWFEQWCAYPLQHPGAKLYTAVALWSVQHGVGKNILAECLRGVYGENTNAVMVGRAELTGSFNSLLKNRQFIHGDEVSGSDKREHADELKKLIADEWLCINEKFLPEVRLPNHANLLFTTNRPDAFFLDDEDRRLFVHEIVSGPKPAAFYERIREWKASGKGRSALLYHLMTLDLSGFDPRARAPMTAAKQAMQRDGKGAVGAWCHDLYADGYATGLPVPRELKADKVGRTPPQPWGAECDLFTPEELLRCFDPDGKTRNVSNTMGSALRSARFELRELRVRVHGLKGTFKRRLYAARNRERWAAADDKEWIKHREQHERAESVSKF
jgi:hypothetical protein